MKFWRRKHGQNEIAPDKVHEELKEFTLGPLQDNGTTITDKVKSSSARVLFPLRFRIGKWEPWTLAPRCLHIEKIV